MEGLKSKLSSSDFVNFISTFDIIAFQETWCSESINCDKYLMNYLQFECTAKTSVAGGRAMGGVSVFIKQKFASFIKRICSDCEFGIILRIDKAMLDLVTDCVFCAVYFPPIGSPFYREDCDSALKCLEETLINNNLIDLNLILIGDFNARTGHESEFIEYNHDNIPELQEFSDIFENDSTIPRYSRDSVVNKCGKDLLRLCKTYGCLIVNGRFGNDYKIGEVTFINKNGCSLIDYCIVSKALTNMVSNFNVLNRPESCHLPILVELKQIHSTETHEKQDNVPNTFYDWGSDSSEVYSENICNYVLKGEFDMLENMICDSEKNINDILETFENILYACSENLKRMKRKRRQMQSNKWFDYECKLSKTKCVKSLKSFRSDRSVDKLNAYIDNKKSFKMLCRTKRLAYEKRHITNIELSINNSKQFWRHIKNITCNKTKQQHSIGINEWYTHFKTLFSASEENIENNENENDNTELGEIDLDDLQNMIFNSPISEEEILGVVQHLKCNKSVSGDILPQHFKNAITALIPYLCKFLNRLYEKGEFPDSWSKSIIVPIHKKGDINSPGNYRGIALLETFSKLYISILTKRLTFYIEVFTKLSESQAGFRAGYTTIDNAFVLYSLVNKYLNMKKKFVYVAFIDFQKAFDSINRTILFDILRKNGLKGKLYNAIRSIYNTVKASVKSCASYSNTFECPIGLRQGCSLSPILFTMIINELNDIMVANEVRGIQLFPDIIEIFMLMFADDIACISDTISGLQKQLNILNQYCKIYKLTVNTEKTKIIVFKKGGQLSRNEKWFFDGKQIEVVSGFCYVGVYFTNRLSLYKMAEAMSIKAQRVLAYLFKSFNDFSFQPESMFFKVFDAKVCSILLYGSEIWGLKYMHCIENIQRYACKRFLNVGLGSCNDSILGDMGRFPIYILSVKRCISYWLRLLKLPNNRYVKLCYNMLKYYDSIGHKNWVTNIRNVLYTNGFGYIWEIQNNDIDSILFLANFEKRLKDQYIQSWRTSIESNLKLAYYKDYKRFFHKELYITVIDIPKFRKALACFRSSFHNLMIEKGRHYQLPREFRNCIYCECYLEDEFHFLLQCPLYENIRVRYIPQHYICTRDIFSFINIMTSNNVEIIRNLGMFIHYAFKKRNDFLLGRE